MYRLHIHLYLHPHRFLSNPLNSYRHICRLYVYAHSHHSIYIYIILSTFTSFHLHLHRSIYIYIILSVLLSLSIYRLYVHAHVHHSIHIYMNPSTLPSFYAHSHTQVHHTTCLCSLSQSVHTHVLLSLSICTHTCTGSICTSIYIYILIFLSLNPYVDIYRLHVHAHLQDSTYLTLFFNVYIHMYRGATGRGHIQPGEGGPRGRRIHA